MCAASQGDPGTIEVGYEHCGRRCEYEARAGHGKRTCSLSTRYVARLYCRGRTSLDILSHSRRPAFSSALSAQRKPSMHDSGRRCVVFRRGLVIRRWVGVRERSATLRHLRNRRELGILAARGHQNKLTNELQIPEANIVCRSRHTGAGRRAVSTSRCEDNWDPTSVVSTRTSCSRGRYFTT